MSAGEAVVWRWPWSHLGGKAMGNENVRAPFVASNDEASPEARR